MCALTASRSAPPALSRVTIEGLPSQQPPPGAPAERLGSHGRLEPPAAASKLAAAGAAAGGYRPPQRESHLRPVSAAPHSPDQRGAPHGVAHGGALPLRQPLGAMRVNHGVGGAAAAAAAGGGGAAHKGGAAAAAGLSLGGSRWQPAAAATMAAARLGR